MKAGLVSVMTFVFRSALNKGHLDIAAMLAGIRRIGFNGIEISASDLLLNPVAIRRGLLAEGLKIACLDVVCDLVGHDKDVQCQNQATIRAGLELAGEYGCHQVLVAGATLKPGLAPDTARRQIADGLAAQNEYARQQGLVLMIENFAVEPELQCRAKDCQVVLDAAGNDLQFVFDTGNFIFCAEDALQNLDVLLPRTSHVHIKSWRALADQRPGDAGIYRGYIGCPIAEGLIPNRELVNRFKAAGYKGWFSLECSVPDDPMAAVARDFTALQSWLASA